MVKNDAGGNKGKGLARKHVNAAKGGSSKQLRVATDEAEKYAVVSKMLGNGMCYVRLLDGSTRDRLCIIRNKFKGRGKRDNILDSGSWVLVGLREWSSKQDTCDLLEVYNAAERDRLLKNEPCFKAVECTNTSTSASTSANTGTNTSTNYSNSAIQFADSATMKYSSMLTSASARASATSDSDDDVPMQQRVYDMPPSDSEEDQSDPSDQSDQSDSDQSEEDKSEKDKSEKDKSEKDKSDSDQSDEEDEEADQEVQVQVHKSNAKKAMNKCEINVDDI
jgi:initiation factor 1A